MISEGLVRLAEDSSLIVALAAITVGTIGLIWGIYSSFRD